MTDTQVLAMIAAILMNADTRITPQEAIGNARLLLSLAKPVPPEPLTCAD